MAISRALAALLVTSGLLLSGCAAGTAAGPVPTASASVTPTPSPTVEDAAVPFDGDCDRALPAEASQVVFAGQAATSLPTTSLIGSIPDAAAGLARLGGLGCLWLAETPLFRVLELSVVPQTEVPAAIVAAHEDFACAEGWCGRGQVESGMWVFAEVAVNDPAPREFAADEMQTLQSAVDEAIGAVLDQSADAYTGRAAPASEDWWSVPACDSLADTVATASGMSAPEAGFPGDSIPWGVLWDVRTQQGVEAWCPWYDYTAGVLSELHLQSGFGAPTAAQLEVVAAEPVTVAGADAAYRVVSDDSGSLRSEFILAVAGDNRLTVIGANAVDVAVAVLAQLG